jgi:hypothetical protein
METLSRPSRSPTILFGESMRCEIPARLRLRCVSRRSAP